MIRPAVNPAAIERRSLVMNLTTMPRRALGKISDAAVLALVAGLGATAAMAGADTTFAPALQVFTDYLEGSAGAIITVLSLTGGIIGMASGRFSLGQIAVPVGVGIGVGTGVPIVTAAITAVI
jgi:conjugal transfer pilus assembly protein TraA